MKYYPFNLTIEEMKLLERLLSDKKQIAQNHNYYDSDYKTICEIHEQLTNKLESLK